MERDHIHRNSGSNVVIGRPDTASKPRGGEIVRVGGHTGRVIDAQPWGDMRGVDLPSDSETGFKPSENDVAIQVTENQSKERGLSLFQVQATSQNTPRTFYVVARSPGEAVGDVVQAINEIGARRERYAGLSSQSFVVTELPVHFPLHVFGDKLEPMSLKSPLFYS